MEECQSVFVYGTLRTGQGFRSLVDALVASCRPATIRARMYHFAPEGSRGDWPFVVPGDDVVVGEVLGFTNFAAAIGILDDVEDCPKLYVRKVVETRLADGAVEHAWVYFIRPGEEQWGQPIPGGDWVADSRA